MFLEVQKNQHVHSNDNSDEDELQDAIGCKAFIDDPEDRIG